jgi:DICT domain-containing protein
VETQIKDLTEKTEKKKVEVSCVLASAGSKRGIETGESDVDNQLVLLLSNRSWHYKPKLNKKQQQPLQHLESRPKGTTTACFASKPFVQQWIARKNLAQDNLCCEKTILLYCHGVSRMSGGQRSEGYKAYCSS